MAIRIVRNASGNCIQFVGSSQPAYWNSCLSGAINSEDNTRVDVINDIRTTDTDNPFFEFFGIPYTEFRDKDGGSFANAQAAADYITQQANVVTGGAIEFSATDTLDASRDTTNTNILFSTGDSYGVHAVKAIAQTDGNITIKKNTDSGVNIYEDIRPANVTVNGDAPTSATVTAVVNTLNALFEVTPLGLGGVDPTTSYTTVANNSLSSEVAGDVTLSGDYATKGSNTGEPHNDWIATTVKYVSQEGEYVEMDWGTTPNGTTDYGADFVMGFFSDYVRSGTDMTYNYEGMDMGMRLRGLETYEFHDYGLVIENGYYNNPHTKQKFRMGLDTDRRLYISFYDEVAEEWQVAVRSAFPTQAEEYGIVFFITEENARFKWSGLKAEEIDPASFNVQYRYIESPDGDFYYPLFSNSQQADWVDQLNGGSGSSHQHVFNDELPTPQTWYMPDTGGTHAGSSAPANTDDVTYTEIPTGVDANYAPQAYGTQTLAVDEGATVNYQLDPQGASWTTTISGEPSGFSLVNGMLQGTAPEVTGIQSENASDDYAITVTRTNVFGTTTGTLTLTVNNLTTTITAVTGFTHDAASDTMVDEDTLANGSVVGIDDILEDGNRIVFSSTWMNTYVRDAINAQGSGEIYIGFRKESYPSGDFTTVGPNDFDFGFVFQYLNGNNSLYVRRIRGGSIVSNVAYSTWNHDLVFYHDYSVSGYMFESRPSAGGGATATTPTYTANGWQLSNGNGRTVYIASGVNSMDISTTGISELANPVVSATSWTKALDYSGGSEHSAQPNGGSPQVYTPMRLSSGVTILPSPNANTTSSSGSSRPWANVIVFKSDGNATNQHIWNQGEGASSSTNDDNHFLRVSATGDLFYAWGREGVGYNECFIGNINSHLNEWHAVYIAHEGARLTGSNATAANLANEFDIRHTRSGLNWAPGSNKSIAANWTSTGVRMDRTIMGAYTIAGRGSNRNFHGKIASNVVTTLKNNSAMPNDTEIEMMITDPMQWLTDYKVGNSFRGPNSGTNTANFTLDTQAAEYATQVWLMGDGTNDSYSQIRNQVRPTPALFYTVLNSQGLVSSDVETVSIPNL